MINKATNAPMQLRKKMHIGSFMDIIYLDLMKKYQNLDLEIMVGWNALGLFREKDNTVLRNDLQILHQHMSNYVNACLGSHNAISHYVDDTPQIHETVLDIVKELENRGSINYRTYEAWYCQKCHSFLAPITYTKISKCGRCGSRLITEKTTDLFARTDWKRINESLESSSFNPSYMKNKIRGSFQTFPNSYAITKNRHQGVNVLFLDNQLSGKVIDPKFVFSLFPIILSRLGFAPPNTLVIGEDILTRHLCYLFSNCCLIHPIYLRIYVHGMLVSGKKKISKRENFPDFCNIESFLSKWSWDHLRLLCLTSHFGKSINLDSKLPEAHKIIVKRKNVLSYLDSTLHRIKEGQSHATKLEKDILEHCDNLIELLKQFSLYEYYRGYRHLWYVLLSQLYINAIKNGQATKNGLNAIIRHTKSLYP